MSIIVPEAKLQGESSFNSLNDEELAVNNLLNLKFNPEFEFVSSGEGASARFANAKRLTNLEFARVNYSEKGKQKLFGVSGSTQPREVLTILGPIHAGKTKLLNILAGRFRTSKSSEQHVDGKFLADGQPMFSALRAGFVAHKDTLFLNSTVEEELLFSATLRLPASVTKEDRHAIVKDLLRSLGLEAVAKTLIKKLSPITGLRKRVAIGMELAMCPNALFLDEPTTNLDCYPAWEILRILNALASTQTCMVVCSIASPSSTLFLELSHVLLLAQGHVLYRGDAPGLRDAFHSKHLNCPLNYNPSDFVLLCARVFPLEALPNADQTTVENKMADSSKVLSDKKVSVQEVVTRQDSSEVYSPCGRHRSTMVELHQLLIREFRATTRDPRLLIGRLVSTALVMTICACVFLNAGVQTSPTYLISANYGSFVFTMFSSCFSTMIPTVLFVFETKPVFLRERALHVYGTRSYALARLLPELVINFVIAMITVSILYWAVKWTGPFILIVVAYYLVLLCCISWSYFIAYAVSRVGVAVGLVALVLVPQMLFMGTFVRINALPIWLQWASYLCYIMYGLRLILNFNFTQTYCTPNVTCALWQGLTDSNVAYPDETLWFILVLVGFFIILRILAFANIHRKIGKARRLGEL
jgi:ABC-type multidrug transport system ATPase subunit